MLSIRAHSHWCLGLTQFTSRSIETNAIAARRAIDEEIALHEATIRSLKTRRNDYSDTSVLPSEILAKIFSAAKVEAPSYTSPPKGASWLNVAGVCQEWRNITLASPQMWSSIDLSRPDRALEMLKRSKSVPLQIFCRKLSFRITEANIHIARLVMAQVHRMQELDIRASAQSEISRFLGLNANANAPLLELLCLESLSVPSPSPLNVMPREMPSLRRLYLRNINISALPPSSHLMYLQISFGPHSSMPSSSLLSSLQYSPNLEEIVVSGVTKDDFTEPLQRVKLPNLSRISVASTDLEASAIFTKLEYPPSATVAFRNEMPPVGEPDFSNVVNICRRLLDPRAPAVYGVKCNGWLSDGLFQLTVACREPPTWSPSDKLTISLKITSHSYSAAFVALCSALPLEIALVLVVGGLDNMTHIQWTTIFSRCKRIQKLHFNSICLSLFRTLIKSHKGNSPHFLPKLQAIHLFGCTIIGPEDRYAEALKSSPFDVVDKFLKQRKRFKMLIKVINIRMCQITKAAVSRLAQYAKVDWDGQEGGEEEEEDNIYTRVFIDDPYGFVDIYLSD